MDSNVPVVSVIIPNYNYARYLEERIESVLSQTYRDFEVILLDDCSTDGSVEIMRRYESHPLVSRVVVNGRNSGSPFSQWEKGLSMARGKYAWIAEADDSAEPGFLERCIRAITSERAIGWVRTMSDFIDSEGRPIAGCDLETLPEDGDISVIDGNQYVRDHMLDSNPCYNASMVVFDIARWRGMSDRMYREMRYVGDWLFWGEMAFGGKIAVIHRRLNRFRLHGRSVTDSAKPRGAAHTRRKAEDHVVMGRLHHMLTDMGQPPSDRYLYRALRDLVYAPQSEISLEAGRIDPGLLDRLRRIPGWRYPLLWLKAHLF